MRQKKKPVCTLQARPGRAKQSGQGRLESLEGPHAEHCRQKVFVPLRQKWKAIEMSKVGILSFE